jgi:hypothetical protein
MIIRELFDIMMFRGLPSKIWIIPTILLWIAVLGIVGMLFFFGVIIYLFYF